MRYPQDVIGKGGRAIQVMLDETAPIHLDPARPDEEYVFRNVQRGSHRIRAWIVDEDHHAVDMDDGYDEEDFAIGEKTRDRLPEDERPLLTLTLPLARASGDQGDAQIPHRREGLTPSRHSRSQSSAAA